MTKILQKWNGSTLWPFKPDVRLLNVENVAPLQPVSCGGLYQRVHVASYLMHSASATICRAAFWQQGKDCEVVNFESQTTGRQLLHNVCACVCQCARVELFKWRARSCRATQRQRQTCKSDWTWKRQAWGQTESARRGRSRPSPTPRPSQALTEAAGRAVRRRNTQPTRHRVERRNHLGITSAGVRWSAQKMKQPKRWQWR